ncbi:hypothetical protein BGZ74_007103 [Mortierella antarctica]|nr:hypothetical protein BGZ74_007103 [Mortierella antarctica]
MRPVVRVNLSNARLSRSITQAPAVFHPAFSTSARSNYASSEHVTAFTADKYPDLQRNPSFKKLSEDDITYFRSILAPSSLSQDEEDLEVFNNDWLQKYRGQSKLVLKPSSTEQVSKILKYCGGVPVFDEIVISTANMNAVRSFDNVSGIQLVFCHIGGNVATNAGGLRLLRYGSLHGTVLGLEVVLPDGTVLDNLSTLRKDNTGYDLKQLFIGSEGTLGIITGVSILSPKRSKAINVALLGLNTFDQVQSAFKRSKEELSEILSAFEFWDRASIDLVKEHLAAGANNPLQSAHDFYVLIETSGSNKDHDDEKLGNYLEGLMGDDIVQDGVVAQDTTQVRNLWAIREGIPEACSKSGAVYKYDISMPVPVLYQMVEDMRDRLEKAGAVGDGKLVKSVIGYGHVGDGNLHLNVAAHGYTKEVTDLIEPFVYEWTAKHAGSISAEHGLGLMKASHLHYSKSPSMIGLMKRFKQLIDPNGIMNPYKYLP